MPKRILIVEDEAPLRHIVALNLTFRGYSVEETESADEAMARLVSESFDLMVLDIGLPDRPGWDVLRESRELGIAVPTVVVSAVRASSSDLLEFETLGYLPKPFPLDTLLRLVDGSHSPVVVNVDGKSGDAQDHSRPVGSEAGG